MQPARLIEEVDNGNEHSGEHPMSNMITERIEQFDLNDLKLKAQTEIKLRQQHLTHKAEKTYRDITRQQQLLMGSLKETPKKSLYETLSRRFSQAAEVMQKGPKPIKVGAMFLNDYASYFEAQHDDLIAPPINDYDELNVKQVNEALQELDAYSLLKVQEYEEAHKNRVTVLREIERLMTR